MNSKKYVECCFIFIIFMRNDSHYTDFEHEIDKVRCYYQISCCINKFYCFYKSKQVYSIRFLKFCYDSSNCSY